MSARSGHQADAGEVADAAAAVLVAGDDDAEVAGAEGMPFLRVARMAV